MTRRVLFAATLAAFLAPGLIGCAVGFEDTANSQSQYPSPPTASAQTPTPIYQDQLSAYQVASAVVAEWEAIGWAVAPTSIEYSDDFYDTDAYLLGEESSEILLGGHPDVVAVLSGLFRSTAPGLEGEEYAYVRILIDRQDGTVWYIDGSDDLVVLLSPFVSP